MFQLQLKVDALFLNNVHKYEIIPLKYREWIHNTIEPHKWDRSTIPHISCIFHKNLLMGVADDTYTLDKYFHSIAKDIWNGRNADKEWRLHNFLKFIRNRLGMYSLNYLYSISFLGNYWWLLFIFQRGV